MTILAAVVARRVPPAELLVAGCAGVTAALLGLMVGVGHTVVAAGMALLAGALVSGIQDWRRAIYGLLLFLPFSGIPYVLLYPNVRWASLLKDVLFVIPAYVGFLASRTGQRRRVGPGAFPTVLLALFALLVVVQMFNPALPNLIVGLIGAKVWFFYVPICVLAYQMVQTRDDLARLLATMSIAAVVPAVVGLAEAALIYAGHADIVYGWYGGAAQHATQGFGEFEFVGGGVLRRIPSTFSFVAQYFAFTVSMVALTYAWWRGVLAKGRLAPVGAATWILLLLASLLSGARAAFIFTPLLVVLIVLLEARDLRLPVGRLILPSVLLVGVVTAILGASAGSLLGHAAAVGLAEFQDVFVTGFRHGLDATLAGLGTGSDTSGARYAFKNPEQFTASLGTPYESWYVKTYLELGIAGLVLVLAILTHLLVVGLRRHATLEDPRLRVVSACLIALLVWNIVYGIKGQFIDMDPTNVYFWLIVGLLAKLPLLDQPPQPALLSGGQLVAQSR